MRDKIDRALIKIANLLKRAREHGVVYNKDKCTNYEVNYNGDWGFEVTFEFAHPNDFEGWKKVDVLVNKISRIIKRCESWDVDAFYRPTPERMISDGIYTYWIYNRISEEN